MKKIAIILCLLILPLFATPSPKANYQMDECHWNGTSGEVEDSSGDDYNGTAQIATTDTNCSQNGMLCNVGDFTHKSQSNSDDSDDDLVQLPKDVMDGLTEFTFTAWIKTNQSGKFTLLSAAKNGDHKDNEVWLFFLNGKKFNPYIKDEKASSSIKLDVNVSDDNWHHIAITRSNGFKYSEVCITIDGDKNNKKCSTINNSDGKLNVDGLVLGQDQDKVLGKYDNAEEFNGYMDEVKIFDSVLSDTDIQDIYNNEKSRKNYDGSTRSCASCPPPPPIADYRMDECEWDGKTGEVKDSAGGDNNGTITGLDINTTGDDTIIHYAGKFNGGAVDIDNLNVSTANGAKTTVTFWMYWDGTDGIMPFGWDRYDLWFYNGSFGFNTANSDIYGISSSGLANGWHHVAAVFTNGDVHANKLYIDGVEQNLSQRESSPLNSLAYVNASARIAGWRHDNNYRFRGKLDELKIFNKELCPAQIQDIYNNEKNGKNYDGTTREPSCCIDRSYRYNGCTYDEIFEDYKFDSGWNNYKSGAVTQSTEEIKYCPASLKKINNNDPNGGWKSLGQTIGRNYVFEGWIYRPSSYSGGACDRLAISDSNFNGYGFGTCGDNVFIERRDNGTGQSLKSASWTRTNDVWYRFRFKANSDNTFTITFYDENGTQLTSLTSDPDTTYSGNFDRVVVHGGHEYYVDGLSVRVCQPLEPIVDYHFDECDWNGTTGEVEDSSGNDHNGTIEGTPNTESNQTAGGVLCRAGFFDNNSSDSEAISTPDSDDLSPHVGANGEMTVTAWIKTDRYPSSDMHGRVPIVAKGDSGNWEYALYLYHSGAVGFSVWQPNGSSYGESTGGTLSKNVWHQLVGVVKKGEYVRIYLDGELVGEETNLDGDTANGTSPLYIARRGTGNHYFHGYIDEVKIFDKALSDTQIQEIYNNEKKRKNYDGSERRCHCCIGAPSVTPLEFEGAEITLNETSNSPHWTHVDFNKTFNSVPVVFILPEKRGSHPASVRIKNITTTGFDAVFAESQGEDGPHTDQKINYLAVNKGIHKIGNTYFEVGTISTKKIQQASQGSLVTNEWERVDSIFSNCQPAVVAQIQSLNNESGLDIPNSNKIIRSIPWMTTAIDVNSSGVYMALERSETNEGNISQNETIGYMMAPANIQDSVTDDYNNTILFETIVKKDYFVGWDDSCKEVSFVNHYSKTPLVAANKNSKNEADGGWFRRCSLDSTKIGLVIDEDGANSSKTKYNYQEPPQDKERNHIPETGAIFAFSDTIVIHQPPQNKNYKFDAWDTFRNINDRNISTRIVNNNFDLTIASLDENGTALQDFNGTVCVQIIDNSDNNKTDWMKLFFDNEKEKNLTNIRVDSTVERAWVKIAWKRDANENCPLSLEDNETNSTDDFAIRPDHFEISLPSNIYAGEDFNISFYAKDENNNSAKDYNESLNSSFTVEANETKAGCKEETLDLSTFSFADGKKENVNVNYDDIGDINLTIKEINGSEFAKVDEDDTNDSQRLIAPFTITKYVNPYEINVTQVDFNTSTNQDWLYIIKDSNLSEMNVTVGAALGVFSKKGTKLSDFNSSCYGKDVNVTFYYDVNSSENNFSSIDLISTISNGTLNDINQTLTFYASDFSNGEANKQYSFEINSSFDKPINPIHIDLNDTKITTSNIAKYEYNASDTGKISPDMNATFYFARVLTKDLSTTKTDDNATVKILVYSENNDIYVNGFDETLLHWYLNNVHTDTSFGDIQETNVTKDTNLDGSESITATSSLNSGIFNLEVNNPNELTGVHYIHLNISPWLWYMSEGFGREYNYSIGSSCLSHPCIKYEFSQQETQGNSVQSGNFEGVDIDVNTSKNKRGIRLFR